MLPVCRHHAFTLKPKKMTNIINLTVSKFGRYRTPGRYRIPNGTEMHNEFPQQSIMCMQVETKQYDTVLNNDIREVHVHIKNGLTANGEPREGD